jgi:hypothetical protein
MPVFANPMSVLMLARAVDAQRHYDSTLAIFLETRYQEK